MSRKTIMTLAVLGGCLLATSNLALAGRPDLGQGANFNGWLPYGPSNAWNKDISASPVDPLSDSIIAGTAPTTAMHADFGTSAGIPYYVVSGIQRKIKVTVSAVTGYPDEGDVGLFPLPPSGAIEGNGVGDAHYLAMDRDNYLLYELYNTARSDNGRKYTANGACMFNVGGTNTLRPAGWTSCDAAGLPILPGLVRYEDLYIQQELKHAIRFTVQTSRRAYVPPGTHWASSNTATNLFPMGARVRLKASFVIPTGAAAGLKVWMNGMKKYGMIMADNGSNWFISGAPDSRFNDSELHNINVVHGSDFEVIQMTGLVTN